jgi:hypothetical protein
MLVVGITVGTIIFIAIGIGACATVSKHVNESTRNPHDKKDN